MAVVVPLWHVPAKTDVIVFVERPQGWPVRLRALPSSHTVTKPTRRAWNGHPGFAKQNAPQQ